MARNKKKENRSNVDVQYKTLEELTDAEFLSGVDKLSVPFYLDYVSAPLEENVSVDGYLSETDIGILAKNAQARLTTTKKVVEVPKQGEEVPQSGKIYTKKRVGSLVVIVVLSLLLLLAAVLAVVSPVLLGYVGVFKDEGAAYGMLSPVFGLVDSLAKTDLSGGYPYFAEAANAYEAIPVYATSCAIVLFFVCVLIIFVKSLVALFEGPDGSGLYKKRKFGYCAVVAALSAVIVLIGSLYMTGGDVTGILSFVDPTKGDTTALYGVFAMILLPVVIAIFSGAAYKKCKF